MPFYKSEENKLHFIESAEFEHMLPAGCEAITDDEASELQNSPLTADQIQEAVTAARAAAYVKESDPLFFKYQRGEVLKEDWLAKVDEIKARYPDGVLPVYTATP